MIKIMIVDDEKLLRQGFKHIVDWKRHGYEVVAEASNGAEALDLIGIRNPDVIITDVKMPVMDGVQFTRIVRQRYPEKIVIILSSYSNFEYVRETLRHGAADYVLKPELDAGELIEVLNKAKASVDNHRALLHHSQEVIGPKESFRRFLFGDLGSLEPDWSYDGSNSGMRSLILVHLDRNTRDRYPTRREIAEAVESVFNSHPGIAVIAACDLPDSRCFALLVETPLESDSTLSEWLDRLLGLPVAKSLFEGALMSYRIDSPESVPGLFQQVKDALPALFYGRVVHLSEIVWQQTPDLTLDISALDQSIDELSLCEVEKAVRRVVNTQSLGWPKVRPRDLKAFVSEAYFHCVERLSQIGISSDRINETRFEHLVKVEQSASLNRLENAIGEIFADLEKAALDVRPQLESPVVHNVREFIRTNYCSNIRLDDLSRAFNINKTYLSHLFKKMTGSSVVDFISHCRVERAKELLRTTTSTIYEIASETGFEDANYFSKVFRKISGTTPSDYRRRFYRRS